MSKKQKSRRSIFSTAIEPFKQLRIGLYVIGISLIFAILIGTIYANAFREQYQQVLGLFNVVDESAKWDFILNDVFKKNAWRVFWVLIAYVTLLTYVVFKMTHKIYGPLVSIERFIKRIEDGDYEARLNIRNKDDLSRLVLKLNHMAESLEKRHKKR